MVVSETMTAARMHTVGGELKLEKLPTPKPGDMDVLVRVRACGIVPNLGNILANWPTWFPHMPQPPLPAVFGLDPAAKSSRWAGRFMRSNPATASTSILAAHVAPAATAAGATPFPANTMRFRAISASASTPCRPLPITRSAA